MKKVLLALLFTVVLAFSGKAQFYSIYNLLDNYPNTGGMISWQYSYDGGNTVNNQIMMEFDTNYWAFYPFKSQFPSNNANTCLIGTNANGRVEPFDLSALPNTSIGTLTAMTTKSLNVAYQVSTTKDTRICVSAKVTCNLSLTGGADGSIILEISPNGSTGWVFAGEIDGSNTGTLTVGLNTTQKTGSTLYAPVKAGYYWRLRTVTNSGTPVFSWNAGSYE